MSLVALLVLAYGSLDWTFPWWVWVIAVLASNPVSVVEHV